MAETATKLPVRTEEKRVDRPGVPAEWRPFESLKRQIDQLFEDFDIAAWRHPFGRSTFETEPFWRGELGLAKAPAVDVVDTGQAYEITVELPGMDINNIDVKFSDGALTIKGEKPKKRKKRRRTAICPSAGMDLLAVRSVFLTVLMPTRSTRTSRMGC